MAESVEVTVAWAWVCPLVKTLCSKITDAPGPEACGECRVYSTWHLAEHVDRRFWD